MDWEITVLSKVSQKEKDKYHIISLTCGIKKEKDTNKLIYKTDHRLRKQIYGRENKLGGWDQYIHTTTYKIGFSWWLGGTKAWWLPLKCRLRFDLWVGNIAWSLPEKEMVTHSSILAWETLWAEEPGRLQSVVLQEFDMTLQPNNNIYKIDNQESTNSLGNYAWYFVITYKGKESEKEYISIDRYLSHCGICLM